MHVPTRACPRVCMHAHMRVWTLCISPPSTSHAPAALYFRGSQAPLSSHAKPDHGSKGGSMAFQLARMLKGGGPGQYHARNFWLMIGSSRKGCSRSEHPLRGEMPNPP